MTKIIRKTEVVSISLPKQTVKILEEERTKSKQSRSSYIASLIEKERNDREWEQILKWGKETAKKFRVTSEDDIDRILHES